MVVRAGPSGVVHAGRSADAIRSRRTVLALGTPVPTVKAHSTIAGSPMPELTQLTKLSDHAKQAENNVEQAASRSEREGGGNRC